MWTGIQQIIIMHSANNHKAWNQSLYKPIIVYLRIDQAAFKNKGESTLRFWVRVSEYIKVHLREWI